MELCVKLNNSNRENKDVIIYFYYLFYMSQEEVNTKNNSLEWSFFEYHKYKRQKKWYVWAVILNLIFIVYSIITVNFLFALIVIMFDIILLLDQRREPSKINFKIDYHGIHLNDKIYPYSYFDSFWIVYHPPTVKKLYFSYKSSFKSDLSIPLEKEDPLKVKLLLKQYLEEDLNRNEESISDILSQLLKI